MLEFTRCTNRKQVLLRLDGGTVVDMFVLFVTSDDHSHLQLEHIIEGFENPLSVPDKPAWATVLELVPT